MFEIMKTQTDINYPDCHNSNLKKNITKSYRAVATRFDKLKQSYENTGALACAYLWLKL